MNLLIVDDDAVEVQIICGIVKKEQLGIDNIFYAYRTAQAKKIVEENPVEIIVCDIEMPGGNGLEFLDWLQERKHTASKIVLTAYEEFGYATWAMRAGSMDYLLKPVEDEQLNQVLKKAVDIQKEQIRKKQTLNDGKNQMMTNREIFFEEIVNGIIEENGRMLQKEADFRKIGMEIHVTYMPVLFCLKKWPSLLAEYDQKFRHFIMKNIAYEIFKNITKQVICIDIHSRGIGVIFCGETEQEQIHKVSMEYMHTFHEYYGEYLCGYLGTQTDIKGLRQEMQRLVQIEKNNLIHENQLIPGEMKPEEEVQKSAAFDTGKFRLQMFAGKFQSAAAVVMDELNRSKMKSDFDGKMLKKFQNQIVQEIYLMLHETEKTGDEIFTARQYQELREQSLLTLEYFERWLLWLLKKAKELMSERRDENTPVGQAKGFIAEHLDEEMNCKDVAEAVHLDADYLSKLFKKETGISMLKYIHKERIHLAGRLLMMTDQSVSDIAMQTGYTNASHFATAFKKETGMSPLEYRKREEQSHTLSETE